MRFPALLLCAGALSLAACGGGGGGGTGLPPQNVPPSVAPTITPTATPTVTPSSSPVPQSNGYMTQTGANTMSGAIAGTHTSYAAVVAISKNEVAGGPSATPASDAINIAVSSGSSAQSARLQSALQSRPDVPVQIRTREAAAQAISDNAARAILRLAHTGGPAAASPRRAQSLPTTVGSTANIWVLVASIGSANGTYTQVPSTLEAVTAHGRIWLDNTLTASIAPAQIAQIGDDFENAYASDTTHFGTSDYPASASTSTTTQACDSTGKALTGQTVPELIAPDTLTNVVVLDESALGSGVGGYFSPVNYITQAAANCAIPQLGYQPMSNEAPMIYVGWESTNGATFELQEDLVRGTAHEFQHLINFVNHAVLATNSSLEDTWINEGLSMLGQDFAVQRMYPSMSVDVSDALERAAQYLNHPQNYSLTAFTGLDPGKTLSYNCSGCYGEEYLFQRYLYDRFGGDAYTHAMEQNGSVSYAGLQQATGGQTPTTLVSDFAIALMAGNQGVLSDPRFTFTNLNLSGTYTDQFGDVLALAGPKALVSSTGTTSTVNAYNGGFIYFTIGGLSSAGEVVTLTDQSGAFGLTAGMIQK